MTGQYFYEDQEATTKWRHESGGRGKKENRNKLRRTGDFGFILTTIMTLRSTNYSCRPQLDIAPSAAHDRTNITEPHPRQHHCCPLAKPHAKRLTRCPGCGISASHRARVSQRATCIFHDILFNLQMISSTPEFDTPFSPQACEWRQVSDHVLLMPSFSASTARK